MKSKRAERHIDDYEVTDDIFDIYVTKETAVQAVELAEEDARERSVKAYCKSVYGVFCDDCDSCDFDTNTCERRNEYLKAYDNGE